MACKQVLRTLSCQVFEFDLCGQERFSGVDWPLTDILRDDGKLVRKDCTPLSVGTVCGAGFDGGELIDVVPEPGTAGWRWAQNANSETRYKSCVRFS